MEVFWKRAILFWTGVVLFWYVAVLAEWIRPSIIKWALPFFGAGAFPDLSKFFVRLLLFVVGVALSMAVAYWPGLALAQFFRLEERKVGRLIPLGWAALSVPLLGLGLVGCWYQWLFAVLLLPLAVVGVIGLRPRVRQVGIPAEWRHLVFVLPASLIGWVLLLVILAPEVFQDAMRYHLFFPARFLLEHKFIFVERYFFWSYMGLPHMLYGAALSLGGELWAKAVNIAFMLFSLATLWRVARTAGMPSWARALLMGLTVSGPGLVLISGSVFIEHCWALYVLLAVEVALDDAGPWRRRLRKGCLLLGLAFMAKYTAIFGLAGLGLMLASRSAGYAIRSVRVGWLAAGCGWLVLPLVPWSALRWIWTGDPFSPLLAKWGLATMDASSRVALGKYYEFAARSYEQWLADPATLLQFLAKFPVIFAGAHAGFWEHPGPAIPCLLLTAVVYFSRAPVQVRRLLLFCTGSAGAWFVLFGAVSPHYIIALCGLWTAGFVGVLLSLPHSKSLMIWNMLGFLVFFQTLVSIVAGTYRWGPRDVAMGIVSEEYYLDHMAPAHVHYAIRKDLERIRPHRGGVYVYGDDTSYYLAGRVYVDYENGSDPLLWRLAAQSADVDHLRNKIRQRGWTHMLYSTRWPEELAQEGKYTFRHDARTLELMQEFWRRYVTPILHRDGIIGLTRMHSYVFEFSDNPVDRFFQVDFSDRGSFLPGADALVMYGDHAMMRNDLAAAEQLYRASLQSYPNCAVLHDRLARIAIKRGDFSVAARHLHQMQAFGWSSAALKERTR